jgi:hypothetical protein
MFFVKSELLQDLSEQAREMRRPERRQVVVVAIERATAIGNGTTSART